MTDILSITSGTQIISGWETITLTRGIERCPSSFQISMTEKFPGSIYDILIAAGDPVEVRLGKDLVLTGWIDDVVPSISAGSHQIIIAGRSRASDFIDCSALVTLGADGQAIVANGSFRSALSAKSLIQEFAAPYGLTVTALSGDGPVIPYLAINAGDTPYQLSEQLTRYSQQLLYDGPDGNLIMSQGGVKLAGSGFEQGFNVQNAQLHISRADRYSHYVGLWFSVGTMQEMGSNSNIIATSLDSDIKRFRPLIMIAETAVNMQQFAQQRIDWERNRRIGRGSAVTIVTDSWRDRAGNLWEPNTIAHLNIPSLKINDVDWLISEVTYRRDNHSGTTAQITLMPSIAFNPQPISLINTQYDTINHDSYVPPSNLS